MIHIKPVVLLVFGTRPEAIKMCPLVNELRKKSDLQVKVCVTGQHREMLQQVLDVFKVSPDYNLNIMTEGQTLSDITARVLKSLESVLLEVAPNIVLVHGDTSTTFATSLACFYQHIPVGHVEAGLRTNNLQEPYPEEFNRQAVGILAQYHFAPTEQSKLNLLKEGKPAEKVFVTGNTAIDALQTTVLANYTHPYLNWVGQNKLILVTAHRRENWGEPLKNIFRAIKRILNTHDHVKAIYPIHMNPQIRLIAQEELGDCDKIKLIDPLGVFDFHNFMSRANIIVTDSGGIQEEAPSLGIPVLVARNTTERPEGIAAGTLKLVGTEEVNIFNCIDQLLNDEQTYFQMSQAKNPYGDGHACRHIADILTDILVKK